MPVSMSAAQREAFASSRAVILHALTFEHAAWTGSLDVVQALSSIALTDETASTRTYLPVPFKLSPPELSADAPSEMRIELDCVPRDVVDLLEQAVAAAGVITVTYRAWDSADPSAPVYGPISLSIVDAAASLDKVSLRAADTDLANRAFPNDDYTPARYPGLVA
jgi:Domain of unknown function (DUF1833)